VRADEAAGPRYLQVAAELKAAILGGDFADGDQLPTESTLTERYGVSRFTVREALRRLQAEGLIRRRRGSGTVVELGRPALRQPLSDVSDLLQYAAGSAFRTEPRGVVRFTEAQAAAYGGEPGSRWVHLFGVRTLAPDEPPIAITDVYILAALESLVPRLKGGSRTLFEQLAELGGFRIARVQQDISAASAGAREAAAFGIPRRSPILRIVRGYHDETGRLVEISVSLHPGERFTYSMHIDQH
jgi:DNA-binding GntR family transcriptional regulator